MPRDLDTPPPERLQIEGPVGALAATWELPAGEPRGLVLHLHPHTVHGGTRQNNVVRHGALGSLEAGCGALRIDFRGAGDSGGEYDEGQGEVDDAEAALRWLQERHPGLPVFTWGFSFGSRVGLDFAIRHRDEIAGYLAVAWPTKFYAWPDSEAWPARCAFLYGTHDEFVDENKLDPIRSHHAPLTVLKDATHFFPDHLADVRGWTARCLNTWLGDR
ncbi:MAG: alpha/beta hydrolase [Planctomycetota bacterium]|nr:alpha/beta hydrolase [Planctomycetota bacterium]